MQGGSAEPRGSITTLPGTESPAPPLSEARWTRPIPAICNLLDTFIEDAFIPDELFQKVLLFICLCFGQDETVNVPEATWSELYDVLDPLLSLRAGRRGEQTLVNILHGNLQLTCTVPEVDRKVTRGAVISSRTLLQHLSHAVTDGIGADTTPWAFGNNLRAALSTSRFIGDDKVAERSRWQSVDYEILALVEDHLTWMESVDLDSPASKRDVWAEGQAVCEILHGILAVVNTR